MADIASAFKAEINRLAGKVVRQHVGPLRKLTAAHRREIAALKRHNVALERQVAELRRAETKRAKPEPAVETATRKRFGRKGLVTHRKKLGLSADHYGKLVGATGVSVYAWEAGKTTPSAHALQALAAVRGVGKREALQRLAELGIEVGSRSGRRNRKAPAAMKVATRPRKRLKG